MISYDWKAPAITKIIAALVITSFIFQATAAQSSPLHDQQIILCLLPLDYANADELANTLTPLMSPSGKIIPYSRTNTLLIKDRASVVKMLIKAVKGREDLKACENYYEISDE